MTSQSPDGSSKTIMLWGTRLRSPIYKLFRTELKNLVESDEKLRTFEDILDKFEFILERIEKEKPVEPKSLALLSEQMTQVGCVFPHTTLKSVLMGQFSKDSDGWNILHHGALNIVLDHDPFAIFADHQPKRPAPFKTDMDHGNEGYWKKNIVLNKLGGLYLKNVIKQEKEKSANPSAPPPTRKL